MAAGKSFFSSKAGRGLVVGIAASAIGIVLLMTGALDGLEQSTWDIRVRSFAAPSAASDSVVVVHVGQSSLDRLLEQFGVPWPWPRSIYGYIVDYARIGGAESVTFDIIFEDEGSATFTDDMQLQSSAAEYGGVIFGAELLGEYDSEAAGDEGSGRVEPWPDYIRRPELQVVPGELTRELQPYAEASFPYDAVIPGNSVLAFVNQANDSDGVFRHYRLLNYHLEQPVPALGLAPLIAASDQPLTLAFQANRVVVTGGSIDDELVVPIDNEGRVLLRYTVDWSEPTSEAMQRDPAERNSFLADEIIVSAANYFAGEEYEIEPSVLEGKHVFVGLSASGLRDLRPTPLSSRAPGVIVHATMLDNLLSQSFLRETPPWLTILILALLAIGAALAASYVEKAVLMLPMIVLFLALPFGLSFGGYPLGYWMPLVVPLVALVAALAGANVLNYATEGAARREMHNMFGRYLSPDVIEEMLTDPEALELGGRDANISIYFSDIQKFSTISKELSPTALVEFLNDYLTPMTNIILEEGGLIDKYEGDAIIAMWGAPKKQEDHAQRAIRSVMQCQAALAALRPEFRERIGVDVYQRIGLNSGTAIVGNMGSELRRDYTMIGDAVNLAARLEGANKAFGTYTMISEDTIGAAGGVEAVESLGYRLRELGNIGVVGREDKPVRIYEPMELDEYDRRSDAIRIYEEGLALFHAGRFVEAKTLFEQVAGSDPAAASYVARCDAMIATPPSEWNGVWVLTEKG